MPDYKGVLFIGDPHLSSRTPGYRKDDYPTVALGKLEWALNYADKERLLPALLGDLFHYPKDNNNWLLGEICRLLVGREVVAIYGNHDIRENSLAPEDSLSVPVKAGLLRLLSESQPWIGKMNGRKVIVGGTSYGQFFPSLFHQGIEKGVLVLWVSHHDLLVPGYELGGRLDPHEIPGVHVVVNGHIHRRLENIRKGKTTWITPGNISRTSRSDRNHVPSVFRIDVDETGWKGSYVQVPYAPHDEVFHEKIISEPVLVNESAFVTGLAELRARKTETGEGLQHFLDVNLIQFEPLVADEIRRLAKEIVTHV